MRVRAFSVVLLALVLGQSLGAATLLESAACERCCPTENAEDEACPPDCDECPCCPSVRCVLTPQDLVPSDLGVALTTVFERPAALPTADPREILHVPIALL